MSVLTLETKGWTPDAEPSDGFILDVDNLLPTLRGLKCAPTPQAVIINALGAPALNSAVLTQLDGSIRHLAGTATGVYERDGPIWADRSRATGYTATQWDVTTFGNISLAVSGIDGDIMQVSTGVGLDFADLLDAPKANIIVSVSGFVLVFGTNHNGDYHPDGWGCSGIYDYTDWAHNAATQSADGRLLDTPGAITAARKLGDGVAVYKARAVYYGQYVGPPIIWAWTQSVANAGCVGKDAVVNAGGVHYFIGPDDIWRYDGTQPQSISAGIREWFFNDVDPSNLHNTQGVYDRARGHVWFFYPSLGGDGVLNSAIVLNLQTRQWGKVSQQVECAYEHIDIGITYDSDTGTYDDADDAFNNPASLGGDSTTIGIFNLSHAAATLTGPAGDSHLVSSDMGDDHQWLTLRGVRPHWSLQPPSATLTHFHKTGEGVALTQGATATVYDHKADFLHSARWHRLRLDMNGDGEISRLKMEVEPNGDR